MGYNIAERQAIIWDSGDTRFSTSTRTTIGTAVARVLSHADETANKYLYVSSFETSMNRLLASLERATGGQEWKTTHVATDEQVKEGREGLAKGEFMKAGKLALAVSFKGGLGGDFATEETLANEMLGLPKEDPDVVVGEIVKAME